MSTPHQQANETHDLLLRIKVTINKSKDKHSLSFCPITHWNLLQILKKVHSLVSYHLAILFYPHRSGKHFATQHLPLNKSVGNRGKQLTGAKTNRGDTTVVSYLVKICGSSIIRQRKLKLTANMKHNIHHFTLKGKIGDVKLFPLFSVLASICGQESSRIRCLLWYLYNFH